MSDILTFRSDGRVVGFKGPYAQPAMYEPFADLPWPSEYAFEIGGVAGALTVTPDPRDFIDPDVFTGPSYWVKLGGNDLNTGASDAQAFRSINKALTVGKAGGVPFNVQESGAGGGYYEFGFGNFITSAIAGAGGMPAFAILGYDGRPINSSAANLTYSDDGSGTNTYQAARTVVARVVDLLNLDANGQYIEMVQKPDTDVAAVRANAGSWCQNGANVSVHRTDGAAVTNANTRAYLRIGTCELATPAGNSIYLEGLRVEGGLGVRAYNGTGNLLTKDVTAHHIGAAASIFDDFSLINIDGLQMAVDCFGYAGSKDIFGMTGGAARRLTVNCGGGDNGRWGQTSTNFLTSHTPDNLAVDIGSSFFGNADGGGVVPVGGSKQVCVDTRIADAAAEAFYAQGAGSELWLDGTIETGTPTTIRARDGAIVHKRNHSGTGVEVTDGSPAGTIVGF